MKNKIKKILSILLAVSLIFAITACSNPQQKASSVSTPSSAPSNSEAGSSKGTEKITITDQIGRTVKLEKPAQRIVGTHNPSMNMALVLDGNFLMKK